MRPVYLLVPALLLIAALSSACNVCTAGSGNRTSEVRAVGPFDRVSLEGSGNLLIWQNATPALRIEGDDNLLQYIKTEVRGGELRIRTDRCVRQSAPIAVYLSTEQLHGVHVSGHGDIIGQTPITTDQLEVSVSGAGDVNLTANAQRLSTTISGSANVAYAGSAQEHDVAISGFGDVDASNLSTQRTNVAISGSGKADVYAASDLDVRISGSGDVLYRGTPRISQSISGRGTIRQENATT